MFQTTVDGAILRFNLVSEKCEQYTGTLTVMTFICKNLFCFNIKNKPWFSPLWRIFEIIMIMNIIIGVKYHDFFYNISMIGNFWSSRFHFIDVLIETLNDRSVYWIKYFSIHASSLWTTFCYAMDDAARHLIRMVWSFSVREKYKFETPGLYSFELWNFYFYSDY